MKSSDTFIFLGLALILFGFAYPMVTLVVDDTPPEATNYIPDDGATYKSLTLLRVYAKDVESDIQSVYCTVNGKKWSVPYVADWMGYHMYSVDDADFPDITTPGTYSFTWQITNNAGLSTTKTGTFTIYDELQGTWYINDVEITSSTQTVYSTGLTVNFKFVKTAGAEDSKISCRIEQNGNTLITLTNTEAGVWEGSKTFTPGKYTLTLVASDGVNNVTFSVVDLQIGETPVSFEWLTTRNILMISGVLLVVYGWFRRQS